MNEVQILTRLRHKNLVSLYGCTSSHSRELLLVYEHVPNGTVACHLHGELARRDTLPWHTRMKIAIETASALSYLHASDIIHRDVKTKNILLNESFSVKVADFGLSRLFPNDVTHVSTAPLGTPGYVDPFSSQSGEGREGGRKSSTSSGCSPISFPVSILISTFKTSSIEGLNSLSRCKH